MNKVKINKFLFEKKVYFFDFDGVIVNSNNIKALNFYKIFNIKNLKLKRKIINYHNKNVGVDRNSKIEFFINNFSELAKFKNNKKTLINKFRNLCIKEISSCAEIEGAKNFLNNIKKNKSEIILCSATPELELKQILKKRKIYKLFDIIYGYPSKKSDIISTAVSKRKKTNSLSDFVYFGDSNIDYLAARNNKIDFVRVKSNKNFKYKNKKIITINDFVF